MKKSVEEKIRNLMAKATDPASSEAEAQTAMTMARKLMDKYDITEDDIKARGEDAFVYAFGAGKTTKFGLVLHPVDKYLGRFIAEFCGCKCWINRKEERMVYFGVDSDVEFAMHLRAAWIKHFDFNWAIYSEDHRRIRDRATVRQSYSVGFAEEMEKRLKKWQGANEGGAATSNALVVKRLDIVTAEMARRGIHLGKGKASKSYGFDHAAAGAGVNAARSASVGKGVGGGARQIAAQ